MLPTLDGERDVLLVNKLSKHLNPAKSVEVGRLYIFTSPVNPDRLICKRVLGNVHKLMARVAVHLIC